MLSEVSKLADLEYAQCSPKREEELLEELRSSLPTDDDKDQDEDFDSQIDVMRKARLAIWDVQVGALKAAIGQMSDSVEAISGLYDALGSRSRGVSTETSFSVRGVSKVPRNDDLWCRAMAIAAVERYPDSRTSVLEGAAKLLGIRSKQVATIVNNFRSKTPANRPDLVRLVGLAENMDDCGDTDLLKELKK